MARKKIDYTAMFTLRKDGRYMGYWHDLDEDGQPTGARHAIYDRDPEKLYQRIQEKEAPETQQKPTFREAAERWERGYRDSVTVRTWNNFQPHFLDLLEKWGERPVAEIGGAEISADLQQAKARGYSRTVVNSRKTIINGILNQALADGLIPFNSALSVRLPKGLKTGKRAAPSDEVIKTICANVNRPFGFFAFLLLCTGLRKSEALALQKSDINFSEREIHVQRSLTYIDNANPTEKTPKNGKDRYVPIIGVLEEPLKKHCEAVPGVYLFPQPSSNRRKNAGGYLSERAYEGAWERYCVDAGFVDGEGKHTITAHSLRHATATLLYESGVDVYTAQQILGHSNVRTTLEIYTDLRKKQAQKSVRKFDRTLSKMLSDEK